jgi:glycosyltransferase involved in cell wall biosynthesis
MLPWNAKLLHRSHMLAGYFAKNGEKVCYVEKVNTYNFLKWGRFHHTEGDVEQLCIYALPYMKGLFKTVFRLNDLLIKRALKRHLRGQSAIALVSTPHWSKAVGRTPAFRGQIYYDISDDYLAFAENPSWFEILSDYESKAIELARKTFLTIDNLMEKTDGEGFVIENGVDLEQFKEAIPADLPGKGRKIGFIGGLFSWIDYELIVRIARDFPDDSVILIGPTDASATMEMLKSLENIHYMGSIPKEEIHHYYAALDIGIIPFLSPEEYPRLTTVNSNKVYQYLYFGYPVVSTSFPQVDRMEEIIRVAKDHDSFIDALNQAMKADSHESTIDLDMISWDSKAKMMLKHFEEEI